MVDHLKNMKGLSLFGRTLEEAKVILNGRKFRVTRIDKTNYIITHDFDLDRFNLGFDNGIITEVKLG